MTVLLTPDVVAARRLVASGELAGLAGSLRADLSQLLDAGTPWIPTEKARLTRIGGRCPAHGVLLDFDPWQPNAHRCPVCGVVYHEAEHGRWWIMNYQLWLAERAVHAAALAVLTDDASCGTLAADILRGYAGQYERYPNRDNVLGPTRPFFSTYLESIWLLQLMVALDLLESRGGRTALGDEVRARLVRPSATLIASYDEGHSNRQVYNNAAIAAAGALLGDAALVEQALHGPSGLGMHFQHALLADGTWYEGENYHLFAHRGLWYGVTIAEALGEAISPEGLRRFQEGFATPFATALPDLTVPSRRDSQYRISLRQWRMAESCELGLARSADPPLLAALAELYRADESIGTGDTGRARSTAEAERNVAPVRLSRASLGWKSLLFARETLPPLGGNLPPSVHLAGQGLAVLRRDAARTYVALDYGESGGGHGHPDRLNLWLVVGDARILEDVGTGSYVDPTLHWYRSTLAHNAPIADGRSQWRADGELTQYDEREGAGLVSARVRIAPGVEVSRTVVVMDDYLVDEVQWRADRVITFDLPSHLDAELAMGGRWHAAALAGGRGLEDGFDFITASEHIPGSPGLTFLGQVGEVRVRLWVDCDTPHEWWRCLAPGPPGEGRRRFLMLRARSRSGCIRSVWSWGALVSNCSFDAERSSVQRGAWARHEHRRVGAAWHVTQFQRTQQQLLVLGGDDASAGTAAAPGDSLPVPDAAPAQRNPSMLDADCRPSDGSAQGDPSTPSIPLRTVAEPPDALGALVGHARIGGDGGDVGEPPTAMSGVVRFHLAREHYRRSEESWVEAGAPEAWVAVAASDDSLLLEIAVPDPTPVFAPSRAENPLDNEHPDINSSGVQLYVASATGSGRYYSWILVPEPAGEAVRVTSRCAFGPPLTIAATACLTPDGWVLRAAIPRRALAPDGAGDFTLDVIINEITAERERRRGQLVLSGGRHEWIYLRGDRQDSTRALRFHLSDD